MGISGVRGAGSSNKIQRDHTRYRQIVQGTLEKDFRKHISYPEKIGRKGNEKFVISLPRIEIPHFRYGPRGNGGERAQAARAHVASASMGSGI